MHGDAKARMTKEAWRCNVSGAAPKIKTGAPHTKSQSPGRRRDHRPPDTSEGSPAPRSISRRCPVCPTAPPQTHPHTPHPTPPTHPPTHTPHTPTPTHPRPPTQTHTGEDQRGPQRRLHRPADARSSGPGAAAAHDVPPKAGAPQGHQSPATPQPPHRRRSDQHPRQVGFPASPGHRRSCRRLRAAASPSELSHTASNRE